MIFKQGSYPIALTLEEANRIAQGALAKAEALNIKINVAVGDAGGRLIVFQRMDHAIWVGVYGSQGKAVSPAAFGRPRADMRFWAKERYPSFAMAWSKVPAG